IFPLRRRHRRSRRARAIEATDRTSGIERPRRSCQPASEGSSMHRSALVVVVALAVIASGKAVAADPTLVEAARREGKVVWYTTLIVNQAIRPLKAAFEKKYPGIELQFSRADETPTATKILEEGVAGRVQADIFDGITNMIPLKRARLLASYVPAA